MLYAQSFVPMKMAKFLLLTRFLKSKWLWGGLILSLCTGIAYYKGYQQYGTGKSEFDDIADCVTTLLQVHADKESDLSRDKEQN